MGQRFTADISSLNKREVRDRLYRDVVDVLGARKIGILAGQVPAEEVSAIRGLVVRPEITAFDLDPVAVEAATVLGVVGVRGNVGHAKTFVDRDLDFVNADLCRTLSTSAHVIKCVSKHARLGAAFFVSYGRGAGNDEETEADRRAQESRATWTETTTAIERASRAETARTSERAVNAETTNNEERATHDEIPTGSERATSPEIPIPLERAIVLETTIVEERAIAFETPKALERAIDKETPIRPERARRGETTNMFELSDSQLGRVLMLTDMVRAVRPKAQLVRAYAYRGGGDGAGGMMMLGVLFSFRGKPAMRPPFRPSHAEHTSERELNLIMMGVRGGKLRKRLKKKASGRKTTSRWERVIKQETTKRQERAKPR